MEIRVRTIPHARQDYDTVGNWTWARDGALSITVSALGNEQYECLVALHEIVEAVLCKASGISAEGVDAWDMQWQAGDRDARSRLTGEPGDDHRSPYHRQHRAATVFEQLMAHELGIRWSDYEAAIEALG